MHCKLRKPGISAVTERASLWSSDEVLDKLSAYMRNRMGYVKRLISTATELSKDVGMDGDDAREFLEWYKTEFNVDMAGFTFGKYFGSEGLFLPIPYFLFGKRKLPMTLGMLVEAAISGVWVEQS
jgi:hypothetical protein